jgi:hypothetical protein
VGAARCPWLAKRIQPEWLKSNGFHEIEPTLTAAACCCATIISSGTAGRHSPTGRWFGNDPLGGDQYLPGHR